MIASLLLRILFYRIRFIFRIWWAIASAFLSASDCWPGFSGYPLIIGLRFDVDLLIRFLLNGPRFIGSRIFNLFRVIFGLIQFIVDFR